MLGVAFLLAGSGAAALTAATRAAVGQGLGESRLSVQLDPLPDGDKNTSDILVDALIEWGATHVFGIVGDGINPVIEALRKRRD